MTAERRRFRLPTPPLWLFGLFEAIQVVLATALLVVIPVAATMAIRDFTGFDVETAAMTSGQIWLVVHAAPMQLTGADTLQLAPLGLTLIPFLLAWRTGRRLAQGAYPSQLWQGVAIFVAAYAAAAGGIAAYSETSFGSHAWPWAALAAGALAAVGSLAGCYAEARSVARMFGVDAEEKLDQLGQHIKWAGAYAWAILRASVVAAVTAVGLAALLLVGMLGWKWMEVANAYQEVDAGLAGDIGLSLLHLVFLPNLVLWALAYATGAGFSVGLGSTVSPWTSEVGALPDVPVLAVIPTEVYEYGWAVLALPVVAGLAAGIWFVREGENHFEDWCRLTIRWRALAVTTSTLTLGLLTGLTAALLVVLPLWLSHVSLGVGAMVDLGPHALLIAGLLGAWVAAGTILGYAMMPALKAMRPRRRAVKKKATAEDAHEEEEEEITFTR